MGLELQLVAIYRPGSHNRFRLQPGFASAYHFEKKHLRKNMLTPNPIPGDGKSS
jgi:hypothetical protein